MAEGGAKKKVLARLNNLRYRQTGYFTVIDSHAVLMHPMKSNLVGTDQIRIIQFLIGLSAYDYRRDGPQNLDILTHAKRHIFLNSLVGLVWGSSVFVFWREGQIQPYLVILTILVGVSAVSISIMSPFLMATVSFYGGQMIASVRYARPNVTISDDVACDFKNCLDVIHPEDRAITQSAFSEALQIGGSAESEYRICATNDEWLWIRSIAAITPARVSE